MLHSIELISDQPHSICDIKCWLPILKSMSYFINDSKAKLCLHKFGQYNGLTTSKLLTVVYQELLSSENCKKKREKGHHAT